MAFSISVLRMKDYESDTDLIDVSKEEEAIEHDNSLAIRGALEYFKIIQGEYKRRSPIEGDIIAINQIRSMDSTEVYEDADYRRKLLTHQLAKSEKEVKLTHMINALKFAIDQLHQ